GEEDIAAVADQFQSGFLPLGGVREGRNVCFRSISINEIIHKLDLRASLPGSSTKETFHVALTCRGAQTRDGANEARPGHAASQNTRQETDLFFCEHQAGDV